MQALTILNDPSFMEAAIALARRIVDQPNLQNDGERLTWAVKECLVRSPSGEELEALADLLAQQRSEFERDPQRARTITGAPDNADATALAAWTSVARVLLNIDEFITRE